MHLHLIKRSVGFKPVMSALDILMGCCRQRGKCAYSLRVSLRSSVLRDARAAEAASLGASLLRPPSVRGEDVSQLNRRNCYAGDAGLCLVPCGGGWVDR